MRYDISNKNIILTIDSLGAQPVSLHYKGKEKLWQNESGEWTRSAPILFPVCGNCRMLVNGKDYKIPFHGFARDSEFTLVEKRDNQIKFSLSSNDTTKCVYPFDFTFNVIYLLLEHGWKIEYEIINPMEDKILYVSAGGHESYLLDEEIDKYCIEFDKEEDFETRLVGKDKLILQETCFLGKGRTLQLPKEFMEEKSLIFSELNSRKALLRKLTGEKVAELAFEGFDVFLLWHPPGTKMVCMEPWLNLPDSSETYKQEFSNKCGVLAISPQEKKILSRTIQYF